VPRSDASGEQPTPSTGKIQKVLLREQVRSTSAIE
jgi:hypothetical protein